MGKYIMIEFAWPIVFLLIPLPWLIHRFFPESPGNENAALKVPELEDFNCFKNPKPLSISKVSIFFMGVFFFFDYFSCPSAVDSRIA